MKPRDSKTSAKSATVHSVVVAARILEFLADRGGPQRVTDIAEELGMTKARTSRHLSTLSELGLVARMPDNSGYRLGSTLFRLANAAAEQYEITHVAEGIMRDLRDRIGEAVLLAIPAGIDALIVHTIGSGRPLTPQLSLGERYSIPASPTAWVLLSFAPDFVRERAVTSVTDDADKSESAPDATSMYARFQGIRRRFFEFALDPHDAGFSVLSMPVFNHRENIEAAMTIVMNRRRNNDISDVPFLGELQNAVVEVSQAIGSVRLVSEMEHTIDRFRSP